MVVGVVVPAAGIVDPAGIAVVVEAPPVDTETDPALTALEVSPSNVCDTVKTRVPAAKAELETENVPSAPTVTLPTFDPSENRSTVAPGWPVLVTMATAPATEVLDTTGDSSLVTVMIAT